MPMKEPFPTSLSSYLPLPAQRAAHYRNLKSTAGSNSERYAICQQEEAECNHHQVHQRGLPSFHHVQQERDLPEAPEWAANAKLEARVIDFLTKDHEYLVTRNVVQWLQASGFEVTYTNHEQQRTNACGYVAARCMSLLYSSTDPISVDVKDSVETKWVEEGNKFLWEWPNFQRPRQQNFGVFLERQHVYLLTDHFHYNLATNERPARQADSDHLAHCQEWPVRVRSLDGFLADVAVESFEHCSQELPRRKEKSLYYVCNTQESTLPGLHWISILITLK